MEGTLLGGPLRRSAFVRLEQQESRSCSGWAGIRAPGGRAGVPGGCWRRLGARGKKGSPQAGWPSPLGWGAADGVEMPFWGVRAVAWELALRLVCGGDRKCS